MRGLGRQVGKPTLLADVFYQLGRQQSARDMHAGSGSAPVEISQKGDLSARAGSFIWSKVADARITGDGDDRAQLALVPRTKRDWNAH
jgi:hypothetical protein